MREVCGWTEGVERGMSDFGHENILVYVLSGSEYFVIIRGYLVGLTGCEWWTRRACSPKGKPPSRRSV